MSDRAHAALKTRKRNPGRFFMGVAQWSFNFRKMLSPHIRSFRPPSPTQFFTHSDELWSRFSLTFISFSEQIFREVLGKMNCIYEYIYKCIWEKIKMVLYYLLRCTIVLKDTHHIFLSKHVFKRSLYIFIQKSSKKYERMSKFYLFFVTL